MKKTVIKRRKRIVPTNYSSTHHNGPPSNSSNSPSPPPHHHSPRLSKSYGPLPPLWAGSQPTAPNRASQSFSPEPQDFTTYPRPYNPSAKPFPSSYNEQNTLPPLRLPMGAHPQSIPPTPSIQHVGNAIPLPKRKLESPEMASKRLRPFGTLLNNTEEEGDPLEGARVLLTLGSRESVIRKRAELTGEIEILNEKMDKLKKAIGECDEFLGKA